MYVTELCLQVLHLIKHIEISYQTLGDSGKREQYDRFGYTAAREQKAPSYEFHNPFGNGFFNFNFNGFNQGESIIQKFDINLRFV